MANAATSPNRPRRKARILPTLAVLFLGAASLRVISGLDAAMAQDPPAGSVPPPAETGTEAPVEVAAMEALRSSPVSDAELSLEILRRERAVEDREAALAERESVLAALEARLQEQVQALETAEAELSATMALADRAAEDDIQRLVGVFEVMKAEDAAAVFAEMDPGFAAGFLSRLPAEIAAEILANLEPRQAYGLSALIAGRNALVPRD